MQAGPTPPSAYLLILNPTSPDWLTQIQALTNMPNLNELDILIRGECSKEIESALCTQLKMLALTRVNLIVTTEEKQSLDNLLAVIAEKKVPIIAVDSPLKKTSRLAFSQILKENQNILALSLTNLKFKFSGFDGFLNELRSARLSHLQTLTISHCHLNNKQALRLLKVASELGIKSLDLSGNQMYHEEYSSEYPTFCQALAESNLTGLSLSLDDKQAIVLASALKRIVQKFEFSFSASSLCADALNHLIEAARANPNLTLTIIDGYMPDLESKVADLNNIQFVNQRNKTLVQRLTEVTAKFGHQLPIENLPDDLLLQLPPQTYLQQVALENWKKQTEACSPAYPLSPSTRQDLAAVFKQG